MQPQAGLLLSSLLPCVAILRVAHPSSSLRCIAAVCCAFSVVVSSLENGGVRSDLRSQGQKRESSPAAAVPCSSRLACRSPLLASVCRACFALPSSSLLLLRSLPLGLDSLRLLVASPLLFPWLSPPPPLLPLLRPSSLRRLSPCRTRSLACVTTRVEDRRGVRLCEARPWTHQGATPHQPARSRAERRTAPPLAASASMHARASGEATSERAGGGATDADWTSEEAQGRLHRQPSGWLFARHAMRYEANPRLVWSSQRPRSRQLRTRAAIPFFGAASGMLLQSKHIRWLTGPSRPLFSLCLCLAQRFSD